MKVKGPFLYANEVTGEPLTAVTPNPLRRLRVGYGGNASVPVEDIVSSPRFQETLNLVRHLRMTRSQEQNRRMWAMLNDVARTVPWHVDGRMQQLDAESWKHIFSAALKKHQRVAAGIDGGFVILGQSTKSMTIAEMGDLMTLIEAFGAERGVQWTDPAYISLMKEYS